MDRCLIYLSKAADNFDPETLDEIAKIASINNKPLNITGMLLYSGTHFLQVLEGRDELLKFILKRIERDDRHVDLEIILDAPIESRSFGDWYMGVLDVSRNMDLDREQFKFITAQATCDPKVAGRAALTVLKLFRSKLPDPLARFKKKTA
jgi:Sensors of blue-light using FAD